MPIASAAWSRLSSVYAWTARIETATAMGIAALGRQRGMRTGRMRVLGVLAFGGRLLVKDSLAIHDFGVAG